MSHTTYFANNQANWDDRARLHVKADAYDVPRFVEDPAFLSGVVRFDRPRLGDIAGLDAVHLQCHIGTDTLSLHRLGARVTGLDLSGASLDEARSLAKRCGATIPYVQSNVYDAPAALEGRTFDLVYTGVGALCWLPDLTRWAQVVAALLRPGGRLFIRDGHPMLGALRCDINDTTVQEQPELRGEVERAAGPHPLTPWWPYFEHTEPLTWDDPATYAGDGRTEHSVMHEWTYSISGVVTALLDAGLTITALAEHDSVPWEAIPGGYMVGDELGEYRLIDRPERLAASFTLQAAQPA